MQEKEVAKFEVIHTKAGESQIAPLESRLKGL